MPALNRSTASTALLVACAVAMMGVAYYRVTNRPQPASAPSTGTTFSTIPAGMPSTSREAHVLGRADAPIMMVEFADFQCPFCARFMGTLDSFLVEHHDSIAIQYRYFPLTSIHPFAYASAMAAACAGAQGRFTRMAHTLFANQARFGSTDWQAFARDAGVRDTVSFTACVRDSAFAGAIRRDVSAGRAIGVAGTPSLVIGTTKIEGAVSLRVLDSIIDLRRGADTADVIARHPMPAGRRGP